MRIPTAKTILQQSRKFVQFDGKVATGSNSSLVELQESSEVEETRESRRGVESDGLDGS